MSTLFFSHFRQAILPERRTNRRIWRLLRRQQPSNRISSSFFAPFARVRQRRAFLAKGFRRRSTTRYWWRWVEEKWKTWVSPALNIQQAPTWSEIHMAKRRKKVYRSLLRLLPLPQKFTFYLVSSNFLFFLSDEITSSFRRYGPLIVDWPHKAESKSYFPPKGYAFLLFQVSVLRRSLESN